MSGPRYHRMKQGDQRLIGYECQECGWISLAVEKRVCKRCGDVEATFESVQLAEQARIRSFVVQERLPDEFETPQPIATLDIPKVDGTGDAARVFGLLTESDLEELEIGMEVEARFREIFTDGDRPIHSFKFSVPREAKR